MILRIIHLLHNSRKTRLAVLTYCVLVSGAVGAKSLECPDFPEPKAPVQVQWVAPYMLYNGIPMSVKRFDSKQKTESILAFYRQTWAAGRDAWALQEYQTGPWKTIAVLRGKCFFTVQVQDVANNGSTGLLSATGTPDQTRVIAPDHTVPMMSGSTIKNDIEHFDEGKTARTLLLTNTFSPEANAEFYRERMKDAGWHAVSGYQLKTKKGPGITMVMKRGIAEASLVITRSGRDTSVLANMVDRP